MSFGVGVVSTDDMFLSWKEVWLMATITLFMSMSLDGFIAGPQDGPDQPLGIDGARLHEWFSQGATDPASHRPASGLGVRMCQSSGFCGS
jgi:hypothetical protein